MIEPSDADLKWQSLFQNYGYNENSFKSLIPKSKTRPKIFDNFDNELPREVSLRISAIRETFEECGILFCTNSISTNTTSKLGNNFDLTNDELKYWQHKVHNDSTEFYNMCQELKCYPNLWALYEWRNWISASNFAIAKHVNAVFFFTGLPNIPNTKLECNEMDDFLWATPDYMLKTHITSLFPPQRYELLELVNYTNIDNLIDCAVEKSKNGAPSFFPVAVGLSDGLVFVLPGDSMYPNDINIHERKQIDLSSMSIKQFREITATTNRIEIFNDPENKDRIPSKL
ncbi:acyl-coenzyme A diphosphatase NUDT19-like isoform X2 [Phymastichus coffea]|nr:acyl-coenzyme A diphosphatase NUDT19-like isoform X2 [Phymastichus coffea]XP_058796261.1 acyl-coenzyme A diphosphatase NUDT19-like isoform X2 [Phymastichus coffea]